MRSRRHYTKWGVLVLFYLADGCARSHHCPQGARKPGV